MQKLELYMKFFKNIMKDENSDGINLIDTNTFNEYRIAKIAIREDDEYFITSLDGSKVDYTLVETLIRDYLISKLIDMTPQVYSFLEDGIMYAISLDDSNKFVLESYKRTIYEEFSEVLLDKH
jgi:hypothetical protein